MDTPREWAALANRMPIDALRIPFYSSRYSDGPTFREINFFGKSRAEYIARRNAVHARVNYRQIPLDRMDEAIRTYRDTTLPEIRTRNGFQGALVLADRSKGKTIAIAFWDTEINMNASSPPGYVDAISGGPPVREVYEVSADDRPTSEAGKTTHARVNTRQIQAGKMDEAIRTYQDSTVPRVRGRQGSTGAIVLTDRGTGKVIAISLWASEADVNASGPSGDMDDISVGPPTQEIYEVSATA